MNTRWRKIAGDFRQHRLQICLIAVVLIAGTAGVIAALNARAVLAREIDRSYERAKGADIMLWFDRVEPGIVELVRSRPEVAAVEPRATAFTRIEGKSGEWFPMRLTVLRDFANQTVNLVHRESGDWPVKSGGILIEQSGLALLDARESVRIRTSTGDVATIPMNGFVHDTAVAPSTQDRMIYGYVTPDVGTALGLKPDLDQLLVKLRARGSMSEVTEFADDLSAWLKAKNVTPLRVDALNNTHPHAMLMTAMLRVLEVLAGIAFICSATLAACVISLWMRREVRQVGVMKTLGARSGQIAFQYLALVAPLVFVAVGLAFPIGTMIGRWVVKYHQAMLNIDVADPSVPLALTRKEMATALAVPLIAMVLPIFRAARMSPRRAIQDPGIIAPRGPIAITSRLIRMPGDRRWSFALRNTFRRPWRLALTLIALSAGGALLLTAHNNYESLMHVIDQALADRGHDIEVLLQRPAPAAQLEAVARAVPDVAIAEAFRRAAVNLVSDDSGAVAVREGRRMLLCGYPVGTQLLRLPLREGRWPAPGNATEVVINRQVVEATPGLRIGSEITVKSRERLTKVRVTGIVEEIGSPVIYAAFPAFENITALGDASAIVRVKCRNGREHLVAGALEQALFDARLVSSQVNTKSEFRSSLDEHFAVVGGVMKMIALASALVGAITLVATVSLGVLERGREIGVIRAIGAQPRAVVAIFLVEGGAAAFLSAALSIAAGIFLARFLNGMAERQLLHVAVPLRISPTGMAVLSGGVIAVILAVWLAVARILRLSVRDALAYE
ncbi:MAG TPA: ABC transporter permease [Chthoniobacterales bacterium]|jgi:putative ABC transport system permease protein|nr:ABC transporter permease [Chthoniobacterales bacterium]